MMRIKGRRDGVGFYGSVSWRSVWVWSGFSG